MNRRRLKNLIVNPRLQLKYGGAILGFTLVGLLAVGVPLYFATRNLTVTLVEIYGVKPEAAELIQRSLVSGASMAALNAVAIAFLAFNVGVILTHRIFGALVPIKRTLGELRQGNYGARARLREADELHDLADEVNALASELDRKFGNQA